MNLLLVRKRNRNGRVHFNQAQVVGSGADTPSRFSARLYYEVALIDRALGSLHVGRALDAGCGYGRLTPWIAKYCDECYAIEPEHDLCHEAIGLYPSVRFTNTSIQRLPFPANHFGLIVSWTVLQHISDPIIRDAIKEIVRVASPNATILIAEYVGHTESQTTWGRTVTEYQKLFQGCHLVKTEPRIVEPLVQGSLGEVMLFRKGQENDTESR